MSWMRNWWLSKLWMTDANKCSWSFVGAKADLNKDDFVAEAADDTAGEAAEETFDTAALEDFLSILTTAFL